jgi:hypothetical protein
MQVLDKGMDIHWQRLHQITSRIGLFRSRKATVAAGPVVMTAMDGILLAMGLACHYPKNSCVHAKKAPEACGIGPPRSVVPTHLTGRA